MLDLIIKNGLVVSPDETVAEAVGIKDGKIVMLGDANEMPVAKKVVDAGGKYVIPGGIDTHTHFELPFQGATSFDDFYTGTRAEAIGGTTSFIDFVTHYKGTDILDCVEKRMELAKKSVIDYSMHCILNEVNDEVIAKMKDVVDMGIQSFKVYMLYKREGLMAEAGAQLAGMEEAKNLGAMFGAHAESCDLTDYNVAKALAEGHTEPWWHGITKNSTTEAEGISRALFLNSVTGGGYYNFHTSCKEGYEMLKKARAEGRPVYGETLTHYLSLTTEKFYEEHGERFICSPPLRTQEHIDALWAGINDGTFSTIGSDECAYSPEQKLVNGPCFVDIPNGMCGLEFRMPVVFSEGVNKGRISINKYVAATSTNAAKIFGLYPQKGIIAIGSDADIVIMDPEKEKVVTADDSAIGIGYCAYAGMTVKGWPVMTISKGNIIVEDGEFKGEKGAGKFIRMNINPKTIEHPIV